MLSSVVLRDMTIHNDLLEGIIIGVAIGLVVVAVRDLFAGGASLMQVLALVLAGVALCGGQVVLSRRRARHSPRATQVQLDQPQLASRRRLSRQNPFAQELTRNWTGLDDHLSEESHETGTDER
jgi:predicted lipid-binding transport protein (Tim44 family)